MEHKYLNLNMGLVKENFVIVKCSEQKLWESRGFEKIEEYPIFGYAPQKDEVIMLGKPLNLRQFGAERLKDCRIIDFCPYLGTYGMGGPGFAGFKIQVEDTCMWLVYCIWAANEHILLDDKILNCFPDFEKHYNPWIDSENYDESFKKLLGLLKTLIIRDIALFDDRLTIELSDSNGKAHTIHTQKYSCKFPEQGGTGKKRNSYESGKMEDYWLVIYDKTDLFV